MKLPRIFKSWNRAPEKGGVDPGPEVADLERLAKELEEDYFDEHLGDIGVKLEGGWFKDPVEMPGLESDPARKESENHLLEFHRVFHAKIWRETSAMTAFERATVADYLDALANNVGYRGLYLGFDQILAIATHLRESHSLASVLPEPWMSPIKLRRRDVKDLYVHLANEGLRVLKRHDATPEPRFLALLSDLDLVVFEQLKEEVERRALHTRDPLEGSVYRNMEYVLACCGNRGAMARLAGHVDDLVRSDPFVSTRDEGSTEDDTRKVVAASWMRLASSIASSGPDPFTAATDRLAHVWLDLRYIDGSGPNTAESRGLVIPLLSPHVEKIPYRFRSWRDDRLGGDIGGTKSGRSGAALSLTDDRASAALKALEVLNYDKEDGKDETTAQESVGIDAESPADPVEAAEAQVAEEPAVEVEEQVKPMTLLQDLVRAAPADEEKPRKPKAKPFARVLDMIGASDSTSRSESRVEENFGRLLSPFPLRPPVLVADEVYSTMQAEFPWMAEANKALATACAMADRRPTRHFRMRPTLLLGPAGVGKTRWIKRVAQMTGVPEFGISLSGIVHTKSIIGSERGWASARPSFMAYGFQKTLVANPIFHVDELDKTGNGSGFGDFEVQEAFLPMLADETSKAYHDIYLLGNMDLSYASFIFSANNIGKVSPTLATRLDVVHVRKPSAEEIERVLPTMIKEAVADLEMADGEIETIDANVRKRAAAILRGSGDLRDLSRHIEDEVKGVVWTPKGPKLHLV